MGIIEERVEDYINGNITETADWLKHTDKKSLLRFIQVLGEYRGEPSDEDDALNRTLRMLVL